MALSLHWSGPCPETPGTASTPADLRRPFIMTMQSTNVARLVLLVTLAVTTAGCEAIGMVFKAGMFTGVIGIALIAIMVFYLFTRLRR
jgi:hypothetical protein